MRQNKSGRAGARRYGLGVAGLGAAVGLTALIVGLEVQVAAMPAPSGVDPTPVNRTLKGDRLPLVIAPGRQSHQPRLPEGCVPASDWHKDIYTTEIAGRCVG
jgi:hypothetical protein